MRFIRASALGQREQAAKRGARRRRDGRDMADLKYIFIEVTLLESVGPIGTVGKLRMICRYKACHVPGTHLDDGQVSVVVHDHATQSWREYTRQTTYAEARGIVAQLKALGIPGRTPEVEGVIDSSDSWAHLFFRVLGEQDSMALDINMQSSGFNGADAEGLRTLFRQLFALAGYEPNCLFMY
jgi:hypothetical protein